MPKLASITSGPGTSREHREIDEPGPADDPSGSSDKPTAVEPVRVRLKQPLRYVDPNGLDDIAYAQAGTRWREETEQVATAAGSPV